MRELILGGARSGKSALAERRAAERGHEVVYIATAEAGDGEMAARIARHRADRAEYAGHWRTVEEPLALAAVLQAEAAAGRLLLVDCLTLWLSNLLAAGEERWESERTALLELLPQLPGDIIMVSNEVGLGVVPMGELSRRFVDEAGRLHQALAPHCDEVTFVAAGLPLKLKG